MIALLDTADAGFETRFSAIVARGAGAAQTDSAVASIIADVTRHGDEAVRRYTAQFDGIDSPPESWPVEFRGRTIEPAVDDALRLAAERIRHYHQRQIPQDYSYVDSVGNTLESRWTPVDRVGVYVPGGTAAYPSTVLMNAIPARIAGVREIVLVTPPRGELAPPIARAAELARVDRVLRIGGAQAIAALALGTQSVPRADVIVGPGNRFVAAAKQQLYGRVGIDMIAGPSEVLILYDGSANPDWIAADMLAQAEHDTDAVCGVIVLDRRDAEAVASSLTQMIATAERREQIEPSLRRNGFAVVAQSTAQMAELSNRFAPEHLQIVVKDSEELLGRIIHAGSIFVGAYAPTAMGDYAAGPNHVLPTASTARFASGLNVLHFLKRSSVLRCTPAGFHALAPAVEALAQAEGLPAHVRSISIRRR